LGAAGTGAASVFETSSCGKFATTFAMALFIFFTTASEDIVAPVMACIWFGFSGFLYFMYSTLGFTSRPLNWSLNASSLILSPSPGVSSCSNTSIALSFR